MRHAQEELGNDFQKTGGREGPSKGQSTNNQPNRPEHPRHTPGLHEVIQERIGHGDMRISIGTNKELLVDMK